MALLDVDFDVVQGVFVCHIPHGADPLYRPPHPADGRWQHGHILEAFYLADAPATAWAEWYRALAAAGLPPARALPRDLWRWRIDLKLVALLDSNERLRRVGLRPPLPTARQWPACQDIGDALHDEGYEALLVASAARPSRRNLVVFRTERELAGCTPQRPPTPITDEPPIPRGMRT